MSSPGWLRPASARRRPAIEYLEDRTVPTLLGNALFPADNPWNQRVDRAPVAANSATLVASIGATSRVHPDFGAGTWDGAYLGIPYNVVRGTQPKVSVVIDAYADESDVVPVPIPAGAIIEGDPRAPANNNGDRHLLVYDRDNNIVYELFNASRPSENADGRWHADSQAVWDLNRNHFRTPGYTSADAAGLPILPGLLTADEVFTRGVIDHAIRFTVPYSFNQYVYPASHHAGRADATLPRMGERFRLKQSFNISGFSRTNQIILQALKTYGMIVADNGSSWYLSGDNDPRWDNDDLHALKGIVGSNFEAVDLRPRVGGLDVAFGPAAGGNRVTIRGLNFAGGAGMTQVYFGAVPATGVVVNSDSSITVTAPPGVLGTTVDVTVRSPYGTSPTSLADRYTYGDAAAEVRPGQFQFGAPAFSVRENGVTATITVTRTGGSDGTVTVGYRTGGGTAAAGVDYRAAAGTLTFAPGQTSKSFTVSLLDDRTRELTETVGLALSAPTGGATLGAQRTAALSILDNDQSINGMFWFSATAYRTTEGSRATVTVWRTEGSVGTTTITYATLNGSAVAGSDYFTTRGVLTFAPGQTSKTFTVATLDDRTAEGTEAFWVSLTSPTGGAVLGSRNRAQVAITDNDLARARTASATDWSLVAAMESEWARRRDGV